jgi:(2S)-methylsuccinyl-CoA dehydrogenase
LSVDGRISGALLEANQTAAHGLAWLATYVESLRQMHAWAERLNGAGKFGEMEQLILQIGLRRIPLADLRRHPDEPGRNPAPAGPRPDAGGSARADATDAVMTLTGSGNTQAARTRLVELMQERAAEITVGNTGLDDELEMIREQFRRYSVDRVIPEAHEWHLKDELIPMEIIEELAEMGVFGLTIPEEFGGFGLSKASMVRRLRGTVARLYRRRLPRHPVRDRGGADPCGGTDEQKQKWLPGLASGEILPTAVFTEPNTGSDLGSLRTKAVKDDNGDWILNGNKTWITHAARTHVMTVLARTVPDTTDYRGLSMFLAEKDAGHGRSALAGPRHFRRRDRGARLSRHEGIHGQFRRLQGEGREPAGRRGRPGLQAAHADLRERPHPDRRARHRRGAIRARCGMQYAQDRKQFGKALIEFPRVSGKLAMMAVEIMIARQLTYFSRGKRTTTGAATWRPGWRNCSGARVAWACADNALQIHGGNGFALEYGISRILCDARILNIFEGAAEIQAQVIARRLLG